MEDLYDMVGGKLYTSDDFVSHDELMEIRQRLFKGSSSQASSDKTLEDNLQTGGQESKSASESAEKPAGESKPEEKVEETPLDNPVEKTQKVVEEKKPENPVQPADTYHRPLGEKQVASVANLPKASSGKTTRLSIPVELASAIENSVMKFSGASASDCVNAYLALKLELDEKQAKTFLSEKAFKVFMDTNMDDPTARLKELLTTLTKRIDKVLHLQTSDHYGLAMLLLSMVFGQTLTPNDLMTSQADKVMGVHYKMLDLGRAAVQIDRERKGKPYASGSGGKTDVQNNPQKYIDDKLK